MFSLPQTKQTTFQSIPSFQTNTAFKNNTIFQNSTNLQSPPIPPIPISTPTQLFPILNITTEFNIYTEIETCFTNIKTLSIFTNSQQMAPSDFNVINVVSLDCLEKLGKLSTIYIKKMNECNLANTKLNTMHDKHLELIAKIIKFNNIYNEVSLNLKHLSSLELSPEQKQFTFDEIFYRYKLQIYEIISNIKIINTYKTILN